MARHEVRVLLVDEPTRGIDIGAKTEVFSLLDELASRGMGIVMVSSELEELVENCDRVVAIGGGRIREFEGDELHQAAIMTTLFEGTQLTTQPQHYLSATHEPGGFTRAREASLLLRYGMIVVLIVMVIVTIILDSAFLDSSNLLNLLLQWAPVGLMAIGMTYVIIAGGFDLSVGGIYAGAAVLMREWQTRASRSRSPFS